MSNRTVPSFEAILADNLFRFAAQLSRQHFGEQARTREEQRHDRAEFDREEEADNERQSKELEDRLGIERTPGGVL